MRNAILRKVLHIMLAVFAAFVLAGTVLAQQQNDRKCREDENLMHGNDDAGKS